MRKRGVERNNAEKGKFVEQKYNYLTAIAWDKCDVQR